MGRASRAAASVGSLWLSCERASWRFTATGRTIRLRERSFGDSRERSGRMLFALSASRYNQDSQAGMPWNVYVFADFRAALIMSGYADVDPVPRLIPRGQIGNASEQVARSKNGDLLDEFGRSGGRRGICPRITSCESAGRPLPRRADARSRQVRASIPSGPSHALPISEGVARHPGISPVD
jgi:hypothetical protein